MRLWVEMWWSYQVVCQAVVSLLVRLWVEIMSISWDPEPKNVSLLVRLWVEILLPTALKSAVRRQPPCEAVSWNNFLSSLYDVKICQPPCEAVSWNLQSNYNYMEHYMSASLWGCELKCDRVIFDGIQRRSASLWGCELKWSPGSERSVLPWSASLWGCELK